MARSEVRKKALRYLVYALIGGLIIIPFSDDAGMLRFVALGGFLVVMANLIRLVKISLILSVDLFPPKGEGETKRVDQVVYYGLFFGFMVSLILLTLEIRTLENTIHGGDLFLTYGVIGLVVGALLIVILRFIYSRLFHNGSRRYSVFFSLLFGCALALPMIVSRMNRGELDLGEVTCENYKINWKGEDSDGDSHYLFLQMGEKEERFTADEETWNLLYEGGRVQLCFVEGRLGYKVVKEIKVPNDE
ncbi:hypothetical protein KFE98_16135 [bacterium SCSIO 12741]|nr:hypothetical protein KFE98_16135 [bacterium SCSIO 12741]